MWKYKLPLLILMLLFVIGCSVNTNTQKPKPDWIDNTKSSNTEIVYGKGISTSGKEESLLFALVDVAIKDQSITENNKTTNLDSGFSFGKVKIVSQFSKQFLDKFIEGINTIDSYEIFNSKSILTFSDSNKKISYRNITEEHIFSDKENVYNRSFQIEENNCTYTDLINELTKAAFEIDYYEDDNKYYTLVKYTVKNNQR